MKKFVVGILMFVCVLGLMTGCGQPDKVVGKWEGIEADVFGTGVPLNEYRYYDLTHQSLRENVNVTFNEDHSVSIIILGSEVEGSAEYPYKWENNKGEYLISIDYPGDYSGEKQEMIFKCEINDETGKMTLKALSDINDEEKSINFTLEKKVEE